MSLMPSFTSKESWTTMYCKSTMLLLIILNFQGRNAQINCVPSGIMTCPCYLFVTTVVASTTTTTTTTRTTTTATIPITLPPSVKPIFCSIAPQVAKVICQNQLIQQSTLDAMCPPANQIIGQLCK